MLSIHFNALINTFHHVPVHSFQCTYRHVSPCFCPFISTHLSTRFTMFLSIHFSALIDTFHHVPVHSFQCTYRHVPPCSCPFISMHLSTRFTCSSQLFFFTEFLNHFRNSTFYWRLPSKFFKKNFVSSGRKTLFLRNFPK
jgi:hypothetical protein